MHQKDAEYTKLKDELKKSAELLGLLRSAKDTREKNYLTFQEFVCATARLVFRSLMSKRDFRGNLQFDHKSKTLSLNVSWSREKSKANFPFLVC